MPPLNGFEMESNVARDVLSTASNFGSLAKVVAEYVTNSIDARENGRSVNVTITKRRYGGGTRVVVSDDAKGMDDVDLRRFFYMHHENEARQRGRGARGKFGTGKAAAFGIGTSLQVETRRNGRRWVVRLEKSEIEAAVRERRKPRPDVQADGVATAEQNGTVIVIDGITRNIDEPRISRELRRCLGRQLDVHNVILFNTRVSTVEPPAVRSWENFSSSEDPAVSAVIGPNVKCVIKAAATSVEEGLRGIIVTSNEFPVAQVEPTGDYAARIFGYCEVLALEQDDSTPGPYTDARDFRLNEDNRTAAVLASWLRDCLNTVTSELGADERERRRRARDEALRKAASKMEAVLNRHYQGEFQHSRVRATIAGASDTLLVGGGTTTYVLPNPDGVAGYAVVPSTSSTDGTTPASTQQEIPSVEGPDTPPSRRPVERDPFGEGRGDLVPVDETHRRRRSKSGGFSIDWEKAGEEAPRSNYVESELTILINLDHPEIAAAYQEGEASPLFRMLVFEAAAQEYCYATAYQQLELDPSMDGSDTVQYVRATIDLLTRDIAEVVGDLAWLSPTVTPSS